MFSRRCPAEPRSLAALRHELDAWLAGLDWPEAEREDVVLAVSEACANAADHAYASDVAGDVAVVARLRVDGRLRRVEVVVRDRGHWRPAPVDPGYRGHGLAVMRGCMHDVTIDRSPGGTVVTMTSCSVPDPAPARIAEHRSTVVTAPAVDAAVGEDRRTRSVILCRAGELRDDSIAHAAAAASAWQRAQSIMAASARVSAESRRIRAALPRSSDAA